MWSPQRFILYFEIFGRYWEKNVMTFSFWPVVVVHICSDLISDKKGTGTKKENWKMAPWPLLQVALVVTTLDQKSQHAEFVQHSSKCCQSLREVVKQATQKIYAMRLMLDKGGTERLGVGGFKSRSSGRLLPQKLCLILLGTLFSAHVLKIMLIQM